MSVSAWIRQACADAIARADDPGQRELQESLAQAGAAVQRARRLAQRASGRTRRPAGGSAHRPT
ncbi:hypothetical protein [Nocardiopsis trehalosi]|uniref:hypothetical protein n=1 Tax=Nocardiopsis trehalosi TaxID=109329 RepID=UPI00082FB672|nr:hypothetical protein [Nocardiopsis trehalosi]